MEVPRGAPSRLAAFLSYVHGTCLHPFSRRELAPYKHTLLAPTFSFPVSYILFFKHLRSLEAAGIVASVSAVSVESTIPPNPISTVRSMATDWQPECILPQNHSILANVGAHSNRALQSTSGNVQSDNIAHSGAPGNEGHFPPLAYKYPQPHAHLPPPTQPVPSVGLQHSLSARHHAKKLRRLNSCGPSTSSSRRARNYLKSQKYLEYRARPRRDTGKDGEAVWSDELEDAFQQGMGICSVSQDKR